MRMGARTRGSRIGGGWVDASAPDRRSGSTRGGPRVGGADRGGAAARPADRAGCTAAVPRRARRGPGGVQGGDVSKCSPATKGLLLRAIDHYVGSRICYIPSYPPYLLMPFAATHFAPPRQVKNRLQGESDQTATIRICHIQMGS